LKKFKLNIVGNDVSETRSPMHGNSWPNFLQLFTDNDFEIEFNNFEDTNFDALICFNYVHGMKRCKSIFSSKIPFKSMVISEPRAVHPQAYSSKILSNFSTIVSTSSRWSLTSLQKNLKYPLVIEHEKFPKIKERQIEIAMVQANKFSCIKGELYTLRRHLLREATKNKFDLILAGHGWQKNRRRLFLDISKYFLRTLTQIEPKFITNPYRYLISKPSFYIGSIENKIIFLSNVKRNIVIENSSDYVSEKLIDSLRSGSVPFYVGPDVSDFGIPSNLIVKCEPNVLDIIAKLESTDDQMLEEIQNRIEDYLFKGGLNEWDNSVACLRIGNHLIDKFFEL
jgi:hypothetical protein